MTTTTSSSKASNTAAINSMLGASASTTSSKANETSDRFLKLLTTQLQNQDPLNPMDNAEITSQTAQINTVTSLEKLNDAMSQISSLLVQMQGLQSASLVGKDVLVAGSKLALDEGGSVHAGFDLAGASDTVVVEVKNAAGKIIDTIDMGASSAGRHTFDWTAQDATQTGLTFNVTARAAGTAVTATPLVKDHVEAVYSSDGTLMLDLSNSGPVKYSDVKGVS